MKTKPTDTDREAATLFVPAPGMRVWTRHAKGRIVDHDGKYGTVTGEGSWEAMAVVLAIDTDDPATVGCMLAQVREADSGPMGYVRPNRDNPWSNEPPEYVYAQSNLMARHFGNTPGAALAAAMRALKGVTPPG